MNARSPQISHSRQTWAKNSNRNPQKSRNRRKNPGNGFYVKVKSGKNVPFHSADFFSAMNPQTRPNANLSGQKNHGLSCGFFSFWTFFWQKKRTLPPWKRFLKNSKKRHTYGISGDLWPLKLAFGRVCGFIVDESQSKVRSHKRGHNPKLRGHGFEHF